MEKKAAAKKTAAKKPAAKKKVETKRVTFSLDAPHASRVAVVGTFNNWDNEKHEMKKDSKGVWKKTVMLATGQYEYKFLVDREWWLDPACKDCVPNPFGGHNSRFAV
ncbi:MAG TPA: glycogen-binding domain-containing protein [bacterium]|nr:glycogen-binding domain-containing protein [bacterium]